MSDGGASPPRRRPGIPVGRLLGIPVYLNASWFLLAVLITLVYGDVVRANLPGLQASQAYLVAFGFVVCLLVSVLLHELGHALTSRLYGIGVRGITLEMLGGYTEMERDAPNPRAEVVVSLAGPAVSAVLGVSAAVATAALPSGGIAHELALQAATANILVAIFNTLPGLPLDGGRALRAAVWAASRDKHLGTRVAGWTGRVVAVVVLAAALLGLATGWVTSPFGLVFTAVVAIVLWTGASQSIRAGRIGARLHLVHAGRMARPALGVPSGTPLGEALRRAAETGLTDLLVVDGAGQVRAVADPAAVAAVPAERRPWVAVDAVARTLDAGAVLAADLTGEDVIRAVQANPAATYLVVSGEDVVGVMHAADLATLLEPREPQS